jgi:membrane protease YdiL (CAAX protease family)
MFFITLQGLLYGLYYQRFGRVWPLIIAHAMYDSIQVLFTIVILGTGWS